MQKLSTRELALSSGLAAISAITQLIHIGYQSPNWGMWIDVVAVSWIIAFFLFGARSCFLVSLLGALIITLFAPDTWLGASMKWIATAPIWLSLYFYLRVSKGKYADYKNIAKLILPLTVGLIVRSLLVLPLNYYYAIPIWTGMPPLLAMQKIPWYIIAGFNTIQGIIDVLLAWIVVFRFRLDRFAGWSK
ncbi:hypothetical protein FJY90_06920 [Candidatus Gottesmanbacteria bacterium]|nr:hypothetical protein [Candidatus Gottesmanbacteria bacterium]